MSNFRRALEKAKPRALLDPLPMPLLALRDTDHTETHETLETLVLFLQLSPHPIPTHHRLILALTIPTVGTDAPRALVHLYEVVVLHCCMHAIHHAELAVVHIFTHLFVLAAGQTQVVLKALARSVKLIANAVHLGRRVEVRKSYTFSHCLSLGNHLELYRSLRCWSSFDSG